MSVLVLGAGGMLGHKLVQVLGERGDVWGTVRSDALSGPAAVVLPAGRTVTGVHAERLESVARALDVSGATAVVNAIGIVKQADAAREAVPSIAINALFPHQLADLCAARGVRLVHVSTDCVFSGTRGGYVEDDLPDARDLYGRSKLLGEVDRPGALTLRTSIVGRELTGAQGLFEWFLGQRGQRVRGFSRAIFSGLTTIALAELIGRLLVEQPELHGLWHVSAAPIDKLTLLRLLDEAVAAEVGIDPDERLVIDRSLDSSRFRAATGWEPPAWTSMLATLAADPTPYDEIRSPG